MVTRLRYNKLRKTLVETRAHYFQKYDGTDDEFLMFFKDAVVGYIALRPKLLQKTNHLRDLPQGFFDKITDESLETFRKSLLMIGYTEAMLDDALATFGIVGFASLNGEDARNAFEKMGPEVMSALREFDDVAMDVHKQLQTLKLIG